MQEAVTARIGCGWKKFKNTASVLCKRFVLLKLRKSFYKGCVKTTLKKEVERKLQTVEMRTLWLTCEQTLRDGISNDS